MILRFYYTHEKRKHTQFAQFEEIEMSKSKRNIKRKTYSTKYKVENRKETRQPKSLWIIIMINDFLG